MGKLRIFIENRELDTLDSVTVPITKQYEELSDPTVICNDYSKTVTIPLSPNNNEIFNYAYNPDRVIIASSGPFVGLNFDPYKKLECRVQWGDAIVLQGYAKMLQVTQDGYEVTINGELGKVFQDLKKITFDSTEYSGEEKNKYWIDTSVYFNEEITKELVNASWQSDPRQRNAIAFDYKGNKLFSNTDVIAFSPNNAFMDNFDYKQYLEEGVETKFATVLDLKGFQDATGVSAETAIGDGMKPREIGEFRANCQIPYLYMDSLLDIFNRKAKELTGYEISFERPRNAAVRLKNYFSFYSEQKSDTNSYDFIQQNISFPTAETKFTNIVTYTPSIYAEKEEVRLLQNRRLYFPDNYIAGTFYLPFTFFLVTTSSTGSTPEWKAGKHLTMKLYNEAEDGTKTLLQTYFIGGYKEKKTPNGYYINATGFSRSTTIDYIFEVKTILPFDYIDNSSSLQLYCEFQFNGSSVSDMWTHSNTIDSINSAFGDKVSDTATMSTINVFNRDINNATIGKLWNNEYKPFDIILNYYKQLKYRWIIDYENKRIIVQQYFRTTSVKDKTDDIDKTQQFTVKPIVFENHYINFNTTVGETMDSEKYKSKYGVTYGSRKEKTNYNFDNSEKDIFEDTCIRDIIYTPWVNSWANLEKSKILYVLPADVFVECCDSDNKYVENFGAITNLVQRTFDTDSNFRLPMITDATTSEMLYKKYYYSQFSGGYKPTTKYIAPSMDITLLPNKPSERYIYTDLVGTDFFTTHWSDYINERYNVQNKIVTCYVRITPYEFINFDFNQFWKIDNQLYIVNKIYDYNISSDGITKVDLITIQDPNKYLSQSFIEVTDPDGNTFSSWEFPGSAFTTWDVESQSDWTWYTIDRDEQTTMQGFAINGVKTQGDTPISGGTKGTTVCTIDVSDMRSGQSGQVVFSNKEGKSVKIRVNIE